MRIEQINAINAPSASGGYSQAVQVAAASTWLFISGQVPLTIEGNTPEDFSSQARLVWANIVAQLNSAGMSVENIVKVTTFLSGREFSAENSEIRREILGQHSPALTVIITGIFEQHWLLEIEAIAAA